MKFYSYIEGKKISNLVLILLVFFSFAVAAKEPSTKMNPEGLHSVISEYGDNVSLNNNVISFQFQKVSLYCIWDVNADRMRIIAPIANTSDLTKQHFELALKANYHTVLDSRYAIGDGIMYSAFIHPLSSINKTELVSAIEQVSNAALTFGTSFSSGELSFPEQVEEQAKRGKKQSL